MLLSYLPGPAGDPAHEIGAIPAYVSGQLCWCGWMRKVKKREEDLYMYRSARSTMAGICQKKVLNKFTWYKKKE